MVESMTELLNLMAKLANLSEPRVALQRAIGHVHGFKSCGGPRLRIRAARTRSSPIQTAHRLHPVLDRLTDALATTKNGGGGTQPPIASLARFCRPRGRSRELHHRGPQSRLPTEAKYDAEPKESTASQAT